MKLKFIPVLKRIAIIVFGNVNYLGKKMLTVMKS